MEEVHIQPVVYTAKFLEIDSLQLQSRCWQYTCMTGTVILQIRPRPVLKYKDSVNINEVFSISLSSAPPFHLAAKISAYFHETDL